MSSTLKKLNSGRLPPKNGKPGNTVKRLSFVLSFDGTDSAQGLGMVKDALEFLAFTIKKKGNRFSWWSLAELS
jgi:hypothetical protein